MQRMKQLMLGNKAFARGLYEAGCQFVSSYPGTPSTEVTEEAALYDEIYASLVKDYGEGRTTSSGLNHAWEAPDGTSIRLNTGFGGSDRSLQYFYINPAAL